jgi:hypothetical protein
MGQDFADEPMLIVPQVVELASVIWPSPTLGLFDIA